MIYIGADLYNAFRRRFKFQNYNDYNNKILHFYINDDSIF